MAASSAGSADAPIGTSGRYRSEGGTEAEGELRAKLMLSGRKVCAGFDSLPVPHRMAVVSGDHRTELLAEGVPQFGVDQLVQPMPQ